MDDQPLAKSMERILAVASQGPSTRDLTGSAEHKRAFLETFRRWEIMFKRKDSGDVQADKWLIAEYYDSLGHLSVEGLKALTKLLKETCTFFPSIRECLDLTKPKDRYDWGHPFLNKPQMFASSPSRQALAAASRPMLTDYSDV
jgi:hypothetical protein